MEIRWAKEKPKKRRETKRLCTKKSNFFRRKAKNIDEKTIQNETRNGIVNEAEENGKSKRRKKIKKKRCSKIAKNQVRGQGAAGRDIPRRAMRIFMAKEAGKKPNKLSSISVFFFLGFMMIFSVC